MAMNDYISAAEAAGIIGISAETLRFWRYAGKHIETLKPHTHVSRRIYYKRTDVTSFTATMFR